MRVLLLILAVLTINFSFGQVKKKFLTYQSVAELETKRNLRFSCVPNTFTSAGSGVGWSVKLNQDSSFTFMEHVDCTEKITVASGKWTIKSNYIVLSAPKFKKTYEMVGFQHYNFLIERSEKQKFLNEIEKLLEKFQSEPQEIKYQRTYLNLQDYYLNRHGKIACS